MGEARSMERAQISGSSSHAYSGVTWGYTDVGIQTLGTASISCLVLGNQILYSLKMRMKKDVL